MCGPYQGVRDGDWAAAFAWATDLGLDGVLFATPRSVSPTLDRAELRAARRAADDLGLFVEVGIGCLGPAERTGEKVRELTELIDAALDLGCAYSFAYTRTERHGVEPSHHEQLKMIEEVLSALRPVLVDRGCRLNVKTHEDLSSFEVLGLVEGAGTDVFGVSLDVANLVVRGEDPAEATLRLAPYVRQTHLEDVALFLVEEGLRRKLRPCGDGVLDWSAILGDLLRKAQVKRLVLEQHRGQFDAEIFTDRWFTAEPHVRPRELARLFHAALLCERRAAEGRGPALGDLQGPPDAETRRADLLRGVGHVRSVLSTISEEVS